MQRILAFRTLRYRAALLQTMQSDMTSRVQAQLTSVARFEQQMNSQLQETIVRETAAAFKDAFPVDTKMQADVPRLPASGNAALQLYVSDVKSAVDGVPARES